MSEDQKNSQSQNGKKFKFEKTHQHQLEQTSVGLRASTCASCHASIDDKYILNLMNMYWHEECLVCSQCGCLLNQTCFFKNGQLFCKDDYLR